MDNTSQLLKTPIFYKIKSLEKIQNFDILMQYAKDTL